MMSGLSVPRINCRYSVFIAPGRVEVVAVFVQGPASRLYAIDYTSGAPKILLYTALSTEASNASDQSSITVRLEVVGY